MHASIKLGRRISVHASNHRTGILSYHDRLALILDDVTGSSHLISPAQAQEHELIRGVYGFLHLWCQCRELPFGSHTVSIIEVVPSSRC